MIIFLQEVHVLRTVPTKASDFNKELTAIHRYLRTRNIAPCTDSLSSV